MHAIAKTLIAKIISDKKDEINRTEQARQVSVKDAQEAEGAMISRYDTFLEEAQYLAGGQNKRLLESQEVVKRLESFFKEDPDTSQRVSIGSLVRIENVDTQETKRLLFVFDGAGGGTYPSPERKSEKILAVSPSAPIGRILFTKTVGEEVEYPNSRGTWEITGIQ